MKSLNAMVVIQSFTGLDQIEVKKPEVEFSHPWKAFAHLAQHSITKDVVISTNEALSVYVTHLETRTEQGTIRETIMCRDQLTHQMFLNLLRTYTQQASKGLDEKQEITYNEELVKQVIISLHESFLRGIGLDKTSSLKEILDIVIV